MLASLRHGFIQSGSTLVGAPIPRPPSHRPLRARLGWPAAGILIPILITTIVLATRPPDIRRVPIAFAFAIWPALAATVLTLTATPRGTRIAVLLTGTLLSLPLFVPGSPLVRCLLACTLAVPFAAAVQLQLASPPPPTLRARLTHLLSHQPRRRDRQFDLRSLATFLTSTAILAIALATIQSSPPSPDTWPLLRWLAAGAALLAAAEMTSSSHTFLTAALGLSAPSLFRSPHRATSVSDFWSRRWNLAASTLLHRYCFSPLRRRSAPAALVATFAVSAVGHALLTILALGFKPIAAACGAFFLLQPLLIAAERRLSIRTWPRLPARIWTLSALAITSPLITEPLLQMIPANRNPAPTSTLVPTAATLAFVLAINGVIVLAAALATPPSSPPTVLTPDKKEPVGANV